MAKERSPLRISPLLSLLAISHFRGSSAIPLRPRFENTTNMIQPSSNVIQSLEPTSSIRPAAINVAAPTAESTSNAAELTDLASNVQSTSTELPVFSHAFSSLPASSSASGNELESDAPPPNVVQQIPDGQVQDHVNSDSQPTIIASQAGASPANEMASQAMPVPSNALAFSTTCTDSEVLPTAVNAVSSSQDDAGESTWISGTSTGPYPSGPVAFSDDTFSPALRTSTMMSTVTATPRLSSSAAFDDPTIPTIPDITGLMSPGGLGDIPSVITVGTYTTVSIDVPTASVPSISVPSVTVPTVAATVPDTVLTSLTTMAVQSATSSITQDLFTGSVQTTLQTNGEPSLNPFPTEVLNSTSLSLVDTKTFAGVEPTLRANATALSANNIFQAIATNSPPAQISSRSDHPVPRLGIQAQKGALETNKFYANFFLGGQNQPTWTHPYSVSWSKGGGHANSWGLSISHIERNQLWNGPPKKGADAGKWAWFASATGVQSLILSAAELGNGTTLTTDSLQAFSVNVNLLAPGGRDPLVTFPLTQGMGFVTAVYRSGTPMVQSGVGINNLTYDGALGNGKTFKYRAALQSGFTWYIYVTPGNSNYRKESFTLLNPSLIQGPSGFGGYIQVAKIPANTPSPDSVYDKSAGAYATAATISGSVQGTTGSYTLKWTKKGNHGQSLLMFALPHHVESFSQDTSNSGTEIQLQTTTKGLATAILADQWTLNERNMPIDMGFGPWRPGAEKFNVLSTQTINLINRVGVSELSQNVAGQTNVGSLYYDGKALAKFATICYTLHDIGGNRTLALTGLQALQNAMEMHVNNKMSYPLVYDSAWGGAVSVSSYLTKNSGDDFGNTYYNDHHFHFGYFVYAAAVIGYLNPGWLNEGTNKAWVNMLVRDYANSVPDDQYFPFSRMFDWYHGHSWAHGVFEAADGKDQESSSEDTMASYAIKMWGLVVGDKNMEARGNLMLAVQARSLNNYYLYQNQNTVQPGDFIGNKAAGIMFENKIDHTTYFGGNAEYIQGIHMLPLMPFSSYTRPSEFVKQEWETYFSDNGVRPASQVPGGWKGVLMANYALVDPGKAYDFFTNEKFNAGDLDGGASQTWYIAWAAGLGGSVGSNNKRDEILGEPDLTNSTTGGEMVSEKVSKTPDLDRDGHASPEQGVPLVETPTLIATQMPMATTTQFTDTMITTTLNSPVVETTFPGRRLKSRSSRLRQRMSGLIERNWTGI